MKRRVFQLTLLLVAGTIVNVAVEVVGLHLARSTTIKLAQQNVQISPNLTPERTRLWDDHASDGWPTVFWVGKHHHILSTVEHLCMNATMHWFRPADTPEYVLRQQMRGIGHFYVTNVRVGYPLRSSCWLQWLGKPKHRGFGTTAGHNGYRIGGLMVPTKQLWPGFAINTIFYAAILWVVFFVPGKVRRTLRRRRGVCPACAYPIGTSPVCTECGKQLE